MGKGNISVNKSMIKKVVDGKIIKSLLISPKCSTKTRP